MDQNGADILRLWVVSADYYNDLRIGPEIIKRTMIIIDDSEIPYDICCALDGYSKSETVDYSAMPDLEKWVVHRLAAMMRLFEE